jgi:hypothetical protein
MTEFNPGSEVRSGIWSDGWIRQSASLWLTAPSACKRFHISGTMPWDPVSSGVSEIAVRIDGEERTREALKQGEFNISLDVESPGKLMHVQIETNGTAVLSAPDGRQVSVRLSSIHWQANFPAEFRPGNGAERLSSPVGIWTDGWAAQRSEVTLISGRAGRIVIDGSVPDLGCPFSTTLVTTINGAKIGEVKVSCGNVHIDWAIPAAEERRDVVLEFADGQNLPPPDARRVGMLVRRIRITPPYLIAGA